MSQSTKAVKLSGSQSQLLGHFVTAGDAGLLQLYNAGDNLRVMRLHELGLIEPAPIPPCLLGLGVIMGTSKTVSVSTLRAAMGHGGGDGLSWGYGWFVVTEEGRRVHALNLLTA